MVVLVAVGLRPVTTHTPPTLLAQRATPEGMARKVSSARSRGSADVSWAVLWLVVGGGEVDRGRRGEPVNKVMPLLVMLALAARFEHFLGANWDAPWLSRAFVIGGLTAVGVAIYAIQHR